MIKWVGFTIRGGAFVLLLVFLLEGWTSESQAQEASVAVNPAQVLHPLSPYLTGACLEDVNHEVYGGLYSQMVFGESFQEPPSSPPILNFTNYGGVWLATNGVLTSANGPGPKLVYNNFNQSTGDVSVEVQFTTNEGGDAGIIFQVSQPGVGADVFNGYEISLGPGGYLEFGKHMQNFQLISQTPCAVPLNQWIKLEVQYTNATMSVFVNGTNLVQYTDTQNSLMSGQVALRNYDQDVEFQDFYINGAPIPLIADLSHWAGLVSGMWDGVEKGTAEGTCGLVTTNAFVGSQSQQITYTGGTGEFGIANRSLNRWGMNFIAGNEYDGCVDVRAENPVTLTVSLESLDGTSVYASEDLSVTSNNWEHINFTLTPTNNDGNGRFVIGLKQAGNVQVGYAFLEPGPWGLYKGLPVRKDVTEGLVNQGITVLRYGGSMVNAAGYRWKNMVGPRDQRPPYTGTWYPYSTDGWGIPDFLNFCEAAGFLGVPDFNINESPGDMADFMEYMNGGTNTEWGARRAVDGHPAPYGLKYLELGNEERVDATYYAKFAPLAAAIWNADSNVTIVVGDFTYSAPITNPTNFSGAASGITNLDAQASILALAKANHRAVWFDVHVWTDGPFEDPSLAAMFSYDNALAQISGGANYRVVVFELNANNHTQGRALGNALAIGLAQQDGRLPIVTSANCLQPDGQNDNGWDQGLLFLNPSQVWLQPPGYVTQMFSEQYLPNEVWNTVDDPNNDLFVSSEASTDGSQLVLKVVNLNNVAETAAINLGGYVPTNPAVAVKELAAPLTATNTANSPMQFVPLQFKWQHNYTNKTVGFAFPANSVTTLAFQGVLQPSPPAVLIHRYSFNGSAGSLTITDSVGSVSGQFKGSSGGLDGNGNLVLNGVDGYVDLGANLITSYSNLTVEAWVSVNANDPTYARLFDFGDTDASTGHGAYGMDFCPQANGESWFEVFNVDPGFNGAQQILGSSLAGGGLAQVVVVYDPQISSATVYTNGVLAMNGAINIPISELVDSHDYIGRSGYSTDPYLNATVSEFRVYSGDMAAAQVAADAAMGPDVLPGAPTLTITNLGSRVVLSWPASAGMFNVRATSAIGAEANWQMVPMTQAPAINNGYYQFALPATNQTAFYQLIK